MIHFTFLSVQSIRFNSCHTAFFPHSHSISKILIVQYFSLLSSIYYRFASRHCSIFICHYIAYFFHFSTILMISLVVFPPFISVLQICVQTTFLLVPLYSIFCSFMSQTVRLIFLYFSLHLLQSQVLLV